jgi:hypothetical protein
MTKSIEEKGLNLQSNISASGIALFLFIEHILLSVLSYKIFTLSPLGICRKIGN